MKLLKADECTFEDTQRGYLRLLFKDGTVFEKVECIALFPFSDPDSYISINGQQGKKSEEIGIIKKLGELSKDQQALVKKEVEFHSFMPEIKDIKKINPKYGLEQWDVKTDRGEKTFYVRDLKENIIFREDALVTITDIDRCRYQVSNFYKLPSRARALLEQKLM